MKLLYALLLITLYSLSSRAQQSFSLTFEDTTVINHVFYTDSTLDPQGIWQIGPPHKSFMNSALTQPNGAVTLLDSLLPPGSMGSFIITVPGVDFYNQAVALTFAHRFQFDSARGGGYVQFSIDSGRIWHNIFITGIRSYPYPCLYEPQVVVDSQLISPPTWWNGLPTDTSVAIPYFTGTDSLWDHDTIVLPVYALPDKTINPTPFMFRFTAFTDSTSSPTAGWLIDNINLLAFGFIFCGGGINEINSSHLKVYPEPASDMFTISMLNEPESDYLMTLYDISGRVVMTQQFTGQEMVIKRNGMDAGSYFIQVTDKRTQNTFQKRMVFE